MNKLPLPRWLAWLLGVGGVGGAVAVGTMAVNSGPEAAPAAGPNTILILATTVAADPSDPAGRSPEQIQAEAAGFSVEVADADVWAAKTTSDFASYRAIVLGDPSQDSKCPFETEALAPAENNRTVWGPAITGKVIVAGAAPTYHQLFGGRPDDGARLTGRAIEFAAADDGKTGAYISLSCYYGKGASATPVPVLEPFNGAGGDFAVTSACHDDVHVVGGHTKLVGLVDPLLSRWTCGAREVFTSFPSDTFGVFAIALTSDPGSTTFPDGKTGIPYVLARGLSRPPVAKCKDVTATSCPAEVSIDNGSFDPDGDEFTCTQNPPGPYGVGTTTVTLTCTDALGGSSQCTGKVTGTFGNDPACCPQGSNVILGTNNSDVITGTSGNDCILSLGGEDTIDARGGDDFIAGGPDSDIIQGGFGADRILGGAGNDNINAGPDDDLVDGGEGTDNCDGSLGINVVFACEVTAGCTAACCSTNSCGPATPPGGCAAPYSQSQCTSYVQGTVVEKDGHNWACSNGNCANCAGFSSCAPGASGCPWGTVWTDLGACQ